MCVCVCGVPPLQAISNASSESHQEAAWEAVCPLVVLLKGFYEYALELETALCELLTCLCSPEINALQHLEQQQVNTIAINAGGCWWPGRAMWLEGVLWRYERHGT